MSKSGGKPKAAKIREGVEDMVLQWFTDFNRPSTAQGLVDALGSRVTKATCQKALDTLVESQSLSLKEIKKAKFYYLDQSKRSASTVESTEKANEASCLEDDVPLVDSRTDGVEPAEDAELVRCTTEEAEMLQSLRNEFIECSTATISKKKQLASLTQCRTKSSAGMLISDAEQQLSEARRRLELLSAETGGSPVVDTSILLQRYTALRSYWRQRKHLCEDVLESVVGDGCIEDFVEQIGLIRDCDVRVSLESTAVNVKKRPRPAS